MTQPNKKSLEAATRALANLSANDLKTYAFAAVKAYLSAEQDRDRWQSIDTAPTEEMILLGWWQDMTPGHPVFIRTAGCWEEDLPGGPGWTDYGVGSWGYEEFRKLSPTHWRPLPEPPANPPVKPM